MMKHRTLIPNTVTSDLNLSNAIYLHSAVEDADTGVFINSALQAFIRHTFTVAWTEKMRDHINADVHACVVNQLAKVRDQDWKLDEMGIVHPDERRLLQSQENFEDENEDGVSDFCGYRRVCNNVHRKLAGEIFKCKGRRFKAVRRGGSLYLDEIK